MVGCAKTSPIADDTPQAPPTPTATPAADTASGTATSGVAVGGVDKKSVPFVAE